jgi:anti-sigma regulatory factor (Ser/Thr protein kinase)
MTHVLADNTMSDVPFRHEALLYAGEDEFVDRSLPFIHEGIAHGDGVLVVVNESKIELLRDALGHDAEAVQFANMTEVGRNPARIIPAWQRFIDEHVEWGRGVRGIGEPIDADRTPDFLVECHVHESLLNVAFENVPGFRLLCPYDDSALDPSIVAEALRNHPHISADGASRDSKAYRDITRTGGTFDAPLSRIPADVIELRFERDNLETVRVFGRRQAAAFQLDPARIDDFVLAVHEVAANSVRHGGGRGHLRMWCDDHSVMVQIADRGRIEQPLVGRQLPDADRDGGRGLWLANQLCDLVQIRSGEAGTLVRLHMLRA